MSIEMGVELSTTQPATDVMIWLFEAACRIAGSTALTVPTSYDLLLILSVFHLYHWMRVKALDPESTRASKHLCATRHTTTLATLLFFHQTAVKTIGLLLLVLGNVNRVKYAALYAFFSRHGTSNLLPFYWWISVPVIDFLAFFTMLGLLIRYPVDGMDIDLRKVNSYWTMSLQHEYGVEISTMKRRGSFGCEVYYSEDDYSETSSDSYDYTNEDALEGNKVHLPMSTVLKLRRRGIDLEKWRYGVRQPTMADSRPSWI